MPRRITNPLLQDYHLLAFDALDSTNDEARRLARNGGSHGAVIWARKQEAGRGRMNRAWESREGNLFVSFLLQTGSDIATAAQLSFVAALAVQDTIAPLLPGDCVIQQKWPNDVLVNEKKIAGILLESFTPPAGHGLWTIIGIGMNVDSFPADAAFPATSLKEAGVDLISAKIVLSRLMHHFAERHFQWSRKGFAPLRTAWIKSAWQWKQKVRIVLPNEEMTGIFSGLEPGGSLILEMKGGKRQVIPAGDMVSLRPPETKIGAHAPRH